MLTTNGDTSLLITSNNDVVNKTRKWRNATNEEGDNSAPIGAEPWRVSVDAVKVVHIRHRHITTSYNVVIANEDTSHRTQENGVTTEESKELLGRCKNLPWNKAPATDDSSKQLTTTDVDVLGCEGHEIVGGTDGVGRDVDTEGDDDETNGTESGSGTAAVGARFHPQADDVDGIPEDLLVRIIWICSLRGGSGEDTEKTNDGEYDWDDDGLNVLCAGLVGVSREIGNVQSQGGVVTQNTVKVGEESPCEGGASDSCALCDDSAVGDGTASLVQSGTEDGQENNWCNNRLKSEEILNLGIRNTQEWQLEQEVQYEGAHASSGDTLVFRNVIWNVLKAWPYRCEQDFHTLTTGGGLDTAFS
jgi:hypothetical protein